MASHEAIGMALALLAGMLLGTAFFAGLLWTVRRGLASPRPALWFGASMLARTALALGGFWLVGGADWRRLAACVAGFVLARMLFIRKIRLQEAKRAA